ncbi:MAG: hypothetical protein ACOH2H_07040 [Cypionkella sp.]
MPIASDMLRQIRWHGVELVWAISYPIHDRDWRTMRLGTLSETCEEADGVVTWRRHFVTEDGAISDAFALIATVARATFPAALIGGGMLTNFTEVNRHQPTPTAIGYLRHGTSRFSAPPG